METPTKRKVKGTGRWWVRRKGEGFPRFWIVVLIVVTLVVGASRIAAVPRSIWHQDEAVFASSVLSFNVQWGRPHPPWFPLWILLGKGLHATGIPAARSLQLLSAGFSVLTFPALFFLWGLWLRRELALAASLLFLFLPGVWMLSGRAFSDTAAMALLAAALALLLDTDAGSRKTAWGSGLAGLTILVRPQHVLLLAAPLAVMWWRSKHRVALWAPLAVCLGAGAAGLVVFGASPRVLWQALRLQAGYQAAHTVTAAHTFAELGPARAMILPGIALAWVAAAALGAVVFWRAHLPAGGVLLGAILVPALGVVFLLVDGTIMRYWLPVLALGCGLAVIGLAVVARGWSLAIVAVAITASAVVVIPQLSLMRRAVSPPIRAVGVAESLAMEHGWTVVADFNIEPFDTYLRLSGRAARRMIYDVELGRSQGVPPPWESVAIYTDHQDRFIRGGGTPQVFRCQVPLLLRVEPTVYDTVTVVPGAAVRAARRRLPGR
ncbi:MAG: hypothetical protein GXP48_09920 [Acidobacteria bacterium]|nr:hypothetical protein [Acidobacteriota bacterium]